MNEVVLENRQCRVVVDPTLGACVKSFKYFHKERWFDVFREASGVDSVNDSSCFPLAPFASRVRNGQFIWNEQVVSLAPNFLPQRHALHGQAWQSSWSIVSHTAEQLNLSFSYNNGDWPWDYSLELIYQLKDNELKMSLTVKNLADNDMPSGLGLHPYFDLDDNTTIKVDASTMWQVDDTLLPTSVENAPDGINSDDGVSTHHLVIDNVLINDSNEREITWADRGFKANIASTGCPYTVLYRPSKAKFLCIEPISHSTNALNLNEVAAIKAGVKPIAPHDKHQITMTVSLHAT